MALGDLPDVGPLLVFSPTVDKLLTVCRTPEFSQGFHLGRTRPLAALDLDEHYIRRPYRDNIPGAERCRRPSARVAARL